MVIGEVEVAHRNRLHPPRRNHGGVRPTKPRCRGAPVPARSWCDAQSCAALPDDKASTSARSRLGCIDGAVVALIAAIRSTNRPAERLIRAAA